MLIGNGAFVSEVFVEETCFSSSTPAILANLDRPPTPLGSSSTPNWVQFFKFRACVDVVKITKIKRGSPTFEVKSATAALVVSDAHKIFPNVSKSF